MTIDADYVAPNSAKMQQNLDKIEALTRRLVAAMQQAKPIEPNLNGPDHQLFAKASLDYWQNMMQNPAKLIEQQATYWGRTLEHFAQAQRAIAAGASAAHDEEQKEDRRFAHEAWRTNPYFNFVKQQYLLNANSIRSALEDLGEMPERDQRRIKYFVEQIIDLAAPTNFFATNPEALEKAVATEGESLVAGLENLVSDLEANHGQLVVKLADEKAFALGENIATTPGAVVYRNALMELIQYHPTTEQVRKTPLIIFPPWINKFYILDLKAKNSLIKWLVAQGYTLFVVSWRNPGQEMGETGLEDYIEKGYLQAIETVKQITNEDKVNAVGYCIAGTTLSLSLARMHKHKETSVNSATFFTTLTDFSEQGEFTPFLQDDFVDAIEAQIETSGVLPSFLMARTFSFLRANDLVYAPAIKSYMMGEAPPAFDLLYWNGDGTNLPGQMARQYLRGLCQSNAFADGVISLFDETLCLRDVTVPLCAIACETDHIAPWKDSYRGIAAMGSRSKKFILAQSGHIAGIVNPPSKGKYGHYIHDKIEPSAEEWQENAKFHNGSWWGEWEAWLRKKSGKLIAARAIGETGFPAIEKAPGAYVKEKAPRI